MDIFSKIILRIIQEQALVIGPLAWSEAGKVKGIKIIDSSKGVFELVGANQKLVVDGLVTQYEKLFGRASREVCRDAVANLLPELKPTEIPSSLK